MPIILVLSIGVSDGIEGVFIIVIYKARDQFQCIQEGRPTTTELARSNGMTPMNE